MAEELDIKKIAKFIYQRKNIFIYILLASIIIGAIYTFIIKRPVYESKTSILIDKADASIEKYITSKDILKNKTIKVNFDKTSKIITATASYSKADAAFSELNEYIDVLEESLTQTYGTKTFKIIETPQVATKISNATYVKDILICIVGGIIIYALYILTVLNFKGFISAKEIENESKMKVLGEIKKEKPANKKETVKYETSNEAIENELKRIMANIELAPKVQKPKIIVCTGASHNVGTSYIVNNLAIQYSKIYKNVLIVDANINTKVLSKEYGVCEKTGIANLIKMDAITDINKIIQKTKNERISILPAGNIEVDEELFLNKNIDNTLKILENNYEVILVDTMSINENVLPIALAKIAESTIIVAQEDKTKIEDIQKAKNNIENVGGKSAGVILNKVI